MNCKCGKTLTQHNVATKTKQYADHLVVLESKPALVCDDCGVVAFGSYSTPIVQPGIQRLPNMPLTPGGYIGTTAMPPRQYTVWNNASGNYS